MESGRQIGTVKDQELKIKQLQEELQLKNQLISLIAHDFSGISRNLLWIIEALEDGSISHDQFKTLFPELKAGVQINQKAIEATVAWVNSQHGGFKTCPIKINAFDLFSSIRDVLGPGLKNKNIELFFQGDEKITFTSDQVLITFILKSFVENAIKYSHTNTGIFFQVEHSDDKIVFIIKDVGIGMSEQVIKNAFTLNGSPYTGTAEEKGTGLSLVIANDFVKLIGGTIKINSIEHSGTQIELRIPVC